MTAISSLGKLIQEGKLDEARAVLTEAIAAPLSDSERGQALVTLATVYMQVKNTINQDLLADIKKTLESMKSISTAERSIKEKTKLAEVREKLNKN